METKVIAMPYLVANALIALGEKQNIDRVSIGTLTNYSEAVIKRLSEDGIEATVLIDQEYLDNLKTKYPNYFETYDNDTVIGLKEGITTDDLRNTFRSSLSLAVLVALNDERALQALEIPLRSLYTPKKLVSIIRDVVDNDSLFYRQVADQLSVEEYFDIRNALTSIKCNNCLCCYCTNYNSDKEVGDCDSWDNSEYVGRSKILRETDISKLR